MQQLLLALDTLFRRYRPKYYDLLLPGATAEDFGALERDLDCRLPPDFQALYEWKNGQNPQTYQPFQNNFTWMPLRQIQQAHSILSQLWRAGDFGHSQWWSPA